MQWYEFAVYGYLAGQMKANFFHGSAVSTWLGFAVTFVGRPLGGLLFGWLADRFGRRHSTVVSLLGMLGATVGQGLLPSTVCCGASWGRMGTVLIVVLRTLQGVCTGGEEAAILPYIAETAPARIKFLASSVFMLTLTVAFLVASTVSFCLVELLDEDRMDLWGWRIPFVVCIVPGLVSLWGRRGLPETPDFLEWQARRQAQREEHDQQAAVATDTTGPCVPFKAAGKLHRSFAICREHIASLAVVFFGSALGGLAFYQAIWCLSFARAAGLPGEAALGIGCFMQVVVGVVVVITAAISDVRGQGPLPAMLIGTVCTVVCWLPLFRLVQLSPTDPVIVGLCVALGFGVLLGIQLGTFHFFFVSIFPTGVRAKLFGIAFNTSLAAFGGFAGVISQTLLEVTPVGPALYTLAVGMVSLLTLLCAGRAQAKGLVNFAHLGMKTPVTGVGIEKSVGPSV